MPVLQRFRAISRGIRRASAKGRRLGALLSVLMYLLALGYPGIALARLDDDGGFSISRRASNTEYTDGYESSYAGSRSSLTTGGGTTWESSLSYSSTYAPPTPAPVKVEEKKKGWFGGIVDKVKEKVVEPVSKAYNTYVAPKIEAAKMYVTEEVFEPVNKAYNDYVAPKVEAVEAFVAEKVVEPVTKAYNNYVAPKVEAVKTFVQDKVVAPVTKAYGTYVAPKVEAAKTFVSEKIVQPIVKDPMGALKATGTALASGALIFLTGSNLNEWKDCKNWSAGQWVKTGVMTALNFVPIGKVVGVAGKVLSKTGGVALELGSRVLGKAAPVVTNVLSKVATKAAPLVNSLKGTASNVLSKVATMAAPVINTIKNTVSNVVSKVATKAVPVINTIKNAVSNVVSKVATKAAPVINTIKNTVSNVVSKVATKAASVVNSVKNTVSNVVSKVATKAASVVNSVKSTVSNLFSKVADKVAPVVNSVKSTVSNLVSKVADKVAPVVNSVKSTVSNTVSKAKEAVASVSQWAHGVNKAANRRVDQINKHVRNLLEPVMGQLDKRLETVTKWNQEGTLFQKAKSYLEPDLKNPIIQDTVKKITSKTKVGKAATEVVESMQKKGWDPVSLPGKIVTAVKEANPLKVIASPVQKALQAQVDKGTAGPITKTVNQILKNNFESRAAKELLDTVTKPFQKAAPTPASSQPTSLKSPATTAQPAKTTLLSTVTKVASEATKSISSVLSKLSPAPQPAPKPTPSTTWKPAPPAPPPVQAPKSLQSSSVSKSPSVPAAIPNAASVVTKAVSSAISSASSFVGSLFKSTPKPAAPSSGSMFNWRRAG